MGRTVLFVLMIALSAIVDANATCICDRDSLLLQPDRSLNVEQRTLKYAPCLRFTSTERFLPTLPFFTAFDGVNNDSSGAAIDFGDPVEIAPWDGNTWVWSKLRDQYDRLPDANKHAIAAAFYRVRSCKAHRVMEILKSDGPRYYRLEETTRDYLAKDKPMTVYEYYFYYVRDIGVKGHPEDIETFLVFVPDEGDFFIMVGGAHSDGDANNVAIYEWSRFEPRTPEVCAFVELGGHAMAPDVPPSGELYRHGFDTNWHVGDAWGIRDVIAFGSGGSLRRYDPWKTENRDVAAMMRPVCCDVKRNKPGENTYFLISADAFFGATGPYGSAVADSSADLDAARLALKAVAGNLPLPPNSIDSIDQLNPEGLKHLQSWVRNGIADTPQEGKKPEKREAKRHIVTEHVVYTASSSTGILKPYLFGSQIPFPFYRRTSGPDGTPQSYVGVEMGLLALSRVKSWLSMQGGLRVGVSYEMRSEDVAVDLGYFTSTARRFTEYALLGMTFPDYHVGAGFIYRSNPKFLWGRAQFLELRAGALIWYEEDLRFSKPMLEFSAALPWGGSRY